MRALQIGLAVATTAISSAVDCHPALGQTIATPPRHAPILPAINSPGPPEPLIAIVTISSQHIELFGADGSMGRSRVSTGQPGHDTPTGVFSVLQRNRFHRSNIYSNAPMPYMQRLTWSGIALHEGHVPSYRASHGCIRLPGSFARNLWSVGRIGMRVIVSPTATMPVAIDHAGLPRPKPSPPTQSISQVKVASIGVADSITHGALQSPFEAAQARLALAVAAKGIAEKAVKPAHAIAAAKASEAKRMSGELKAAARVLLDAVAQLEFENQRMATVQTEPAEAKIRQDIRLAELNVTAAREAHDKIRKAEAEASAAAFAAAVVAREARVAAEAAVEELGLARKAVSPLSVFVSRRTGRIYVRQGFLELYDGLAEIADPDRPLGTHVFTAMRERGPGEVLDWVSVTVPTNGGAREARRGEPVLPAKLASTASEALDRIGMSDEVRELIAERLWPGASLIISDFGLGETNQHTDFVILTR